MKHHIKKLSFLSFVCIASPSLNVHGAMELTKPQKELLVHGYCKALHIPTGVLCIITYFLYDNPLQYRQKTLPPDLSGRDLSDFDFTGCQFTTTNLTDAKLDRIILAGTTCDYQKAFQDNIKRVFDGEWYKENLPKDLQSIALVYPKLDSNAHKAKLLLIASGFAQLPSYEGTEFDIKVQYWSCELLRLKKKLGSSHGKQLFCSLTKSLTRNANFYCWKIRYSKTKGGIDADIPHENFEKYLQNFKRGVSKCTSHNSDGCASYQDHITKNIESLQKAYPKIKNKKLQQEACDIAHTLSKSCQIEQWELLHCYLLAQNRLIRLKKLMNAKLNMDIHLYYKMAMGPYLPTGWSTSQQ